MELFTAQFRLGFDDENRKDQFVVATDIILKSDEPGYLLAHLICLALDNINTNSYSISQEMHYKIRERLDRLKA